jgi:hypothetical protein
MTACGENGLFDRPGREANIRQADIDPPKENDPASRLAASTNIDRALHGEPTWAVSVQSNSDLAA